MRPNEDYSQSAVEIALTGDLGEHEAEIADKLLSVPSGGNCTLYFDSPGGSAYCAISIMSVMLIRNLNATGIVTGECSSAALWPLAACRRRIVTPYSVMLFHPMRWQSEENVQLAEAAEWARHFAVLENEMERLLADFFGVSHDLMASWVKPGRYVGGREFAAEGLAEMWEFVPHAPPENGQLRIAGRAKANTAKPRTASSRPKV